MPDRIQSEIEVASLQLAALRRANQTDSDITENRLLAEDAKGLEANPLLKPQEVANLLAKELQLGSSAGLFDVRLWEEEDPPSIQVLSNPGHENEQTLCVLRFPHGTRYDRETIREFLAPIIRQHFRNLLREALTGEREGSLVNLEFR
jgi:hypothetical protein